MHLKKQPIAPALYASSEARPRMRPGETSIPFKNCPALERDRELAGFLVLCGRSV